MDTDFFPASASESASGLLILVPGHNMPRSDFIGHGFLDVLRVAAPGVDVLLVEPDVGSYLDGAVAALFRDLLVQRRSDSYSRIWMAGISLGCFGALLTAA